MVHSCPFNLAPAIQRINTQFILFGLTTNASDEKRPDLAAGVHLFPTPLGALAAVYL